MARAAVRAKQAQQAQATTTVGKPRRDRKHASGGNPNQDLFFSRLRRKQKWIFVALAIVFGISFTAIGVGSGNGNFLDQLWQGIGGGANDQISKAQAEIKTDPSKGYRDLADAYVANGDLNGAVTTLNGYLRTQQTDWLAWQQFAGLRKQQGDTYAAQYQQVIQANSLSAPGTVFAPTGKLAQAFGTNPIDDYYSNLSQQQSAPIYQNMTTAYQDSLSGYQQAAKYAKGKSSKAAMELDVANAALNVQGQTAAALVALQQYVQLDPTSPYLKQIEAKCKQYGGTCTPKHGAHAK